MERLLLVLILAAVASLIAWAASRMQRTAGPTVVGATPEHLERGDFVAADSPWLLALFSSATCLACRDVRTALSAFESGTVAVQDIEVTASPQLHSRYKIDSVPTTVLADADGIVRGAWLGPLSVSDTEDLLALISD